MSAYLCDPKTIAVAATVSGLSVLDVARLNLKAVAYRYRITPKQVAQEFLGYKTLKRYLDDCKEAAPLDLFDTAANLDKLGEVIYQCTEGYYPSTEVYQAMKRKERELQNERVTEAAGWSIS